MAKNDRSKKTAQETVRAESQDKVPFLGEILSQPEYEECCRNLCAFFDILKSWKDGDSDESEKL